MDIIYLVYGLSFLMLALVLLIWPKTDSQLELARHTPWLAAFAFVHGLFEWTDLWRVVRGDNPTLALIKPFTLLLSFILLFEFGRRFARVSLPEGRSRLLAQPFLDARSLLILVGGVAAGSIFSEHWALNLTIWSRYLFQVPGCTLAGIAFFSYTRRIQPILPEMEIRPIQHACQLAGSAFIAYGMLGGLTVPRADWAPPSWINQESFLSLTGVPIEIFRTVCAVLMTFSVGKILKVFYLEGKQRLREAFAETALALHEVKRLSQRNQLLLASVAESIVGVDEAGNITFVNPTAERLFGVSESELLGRPVHDLVDATPFTTLEHSTRQVLQDGQPRHADGEPWSRQDGSRMLVEYHVTPVMDEDKLAGAVLVFQDITERKRSEAALRDSERRFQELAARIPSGIYRLCQRREGGYSLDYVSPRLCEMLDLPQGAPLCDANGILSRFAPEDLENLKRLMESASQTLARIFSETRCLVGGESSWKRIDATPMRLTNGDILWDGVITDITERKRSEELTRVRLDLVSRSHHLPLEEFIQVGVDAAEQLTGSQIGYFHFVDDDQDNLTLQVWSTNTLRDLSQAHGKELHRPISKAGVWADCFRARTAVIHNDYAGLSHRKGLPEGHVPIVREIGVPVVEGDKVLAIMGVGNKAHGYTRDDGEIVQRIATMLTDIAARKSAEAKLQLTELAFTNAQEAIIVTDEKANILDVNPAFSVITGYSRKEVIGKNPRFLSSGRQDKSFYQAMWRSLVDEGHWEGDLWNRRKDGRFYIQHAKISAVREPANRIARYVSIASDVTLVKESQRKVEHLAYYDALTNLPNRALFADRLKQAIAQASRWKQLLAVCYLDLDGFKPINDTYGHNTGDQLLMEIAKRLQSATRSVDTVARLGGDEFVVLLGEAADAQEIEQAVRRFQWAIASPIRVAAAEASITASIGVAIYPGDGQDPDMLLRHADQAMYAAKESGKNRFCLFDAESDRRVKAYRATISRVEEGLVKGEFRLYYQPKVDMRQGSVVGLEALIRWQHPEKQLLAPIDFLPIVEGSDAMLAIDEWVLREALRQMSAWAAEGLDLAVSVNVSARSLQQGNFQETLSRLLGEFPAVNPHRLELEILETTAMDDLDTISAVISGCSELGVKFAMDDFGTGYASLTYFRRLPTQFLKIDQSFIRDMLDDMDDLAIVEGVIGLAWAFQRNIIAEGVETIEHGIPLLLFGCFLAQGYAIAHPMPPAEVPAWLTSWKLPPEWEAVTALHGKREDFPLMLAEIHHRRWIEQFVDICEGRRPVTSMPPLDTHQCRFGQWLYGVGKDRYGSLATFQAIERVHDRVHAKGKELLNLLITDPEAACVRTWELRAIRDELEKSLDKLKVQVLSGTRMVH